MVWSMDGGERVALLSVCYLAKASEREWLAVERPRPSPNPGMGSTRGVDFYGEACRTILGQETREALQVLDDQDPDGSYAHPTTSLV